jgi:hypothetical protein
MAMVAVEPEQTNNLSVVNVLQAFSAAISFSDSFAIGILVSSVTGDYSTELQT